MTTNFAAARKYAETFEGKGDPDNYLETEEYLERLEQIGCGINWDGVKSEIESSEWQKTFDGDRCEKLVFLGTCFAIMPSGKYYMPFACSNVDACPLCEGKGKIPNLDGNAEDFDDLMVIESRIGEYAQKRHGMYWDWPQSFRDVINTIRTHKELKDPEIECPECSGVGSREAYWDEVYREKLEEEADEHGFFVAGGEGDPCDIFAGISADLEEIPEDERPEE